MPSAPPAHEGDDTPSAAAAASAAAARADAGAALPRLEALIGLIRPLQLYRVVADLLGLPGTDVADLAVGVVVPALPRDRIGDRFAQFVRCGRGQRLPGREAAAAAGATRIGHHRVKDLARDIVVVPAECLAGCRA